LKLIQHGVDHIQTNQTDQNSSVLEAISTASNSAYQKGVKEGQGAEHQRVVALQSAVDNLKGSYTPLQKELSAQMVDFNQLGQQYSDLGIKLDGQRKSVNNLAHAVIGGLDIHAEELATPIVDAILEQTGKTLDQHITDETNASLERFSGAVEASEKQFNYQKKVLKDLSDGVFKSTKLIKKIAIWSLSCFGGSMALVAALPGWWKLFGLVPLIAGVLYVWRAE